jgi:mRNA-degrading endonuclease RelE of RelBE toxin-antitoxin system
MTWRIQWSPLAARRLRELPWRDATRVDAAVLRFAESGDGQVVRIPSDDPVTLRLRVPPYFIRFTLDPFSGVMHIWTVYRL